MMGDELQRKKQTISGLNLFSIRNNSRGTKLVTLNKELMLERLAHDFKSLSSLKTLNELFVKANDIVSNNLVRLSICNVFRTEKK